MYLVNPQGVVVSNFVDLVNYYPEKIDALDAELANIYSKYINWTGANYGRKKEFRYHAGFKYDSVYYSSTTDLVYGYSKTKGSKGSSSDRQDSVSQKVYTYETFEKFFEGLYNKDFPSAVSPISKNGGTIETTDFRTGATISIPRDIQGPVQRLKDGSGQEGTGDIFVNQLYTKCEDGDLVLLKIIDMQMPVMNIHGEEVGGIEPLFNFVYEDDIELLNQLNSVDGKNHIVDVVKQQGYKLCAEPIHWAVNEVVLPTAPDGSNGVDLNAFYWTPRVEYGTVSQISFLTYNWLWDATKLWMQKYGWYTTDDAVTQYIAQAGQSWDWSLAYTAYMLDRTDVDLGMYSFADCGIDPDTAEQQRLRFWHDYAGSLGYGIIVTDINAGKNGGTSSWDEDIYSEDGTNGVYSPGPSEDTSTQGGNELKNNIVKFYARKDGNNNYVYQENHTRMNTISPIEIEDEENYLVDSWYVSDTFKQPTKSNDSYDTWKNSMNNTQTGTSEETVEINAGQTLYIRLVESLRVIKVYETDGNVDKIKIETPTLDGDKYKVITPDNGYNYTESFISPESKDITRWNDIPTNGTPSEDLTLKIPDTTKVIYIRYTKDSSDNAVLVLHENEISHNFNLRDITGDLLKTTRHYKYISVPECDYFYDCGCSDDDDSCDCWSCNEDMDQESPGTYHFEVVNKPSYNKEFVYKWKESNTVYNGEGGGYQGFEVEAAPYMEFTLSRAYGDNFYENRSQGSVFFYFLQHYSSKLFRG